MNKIVLMSLVASSVLMASGYKIPEQSTASVAKSAATVANLSGADASYYNPASMSTLKDGSALEAGLTYIHLPEVDFSTFSSEKENFLLPYFHYVSPKYGNLRYGLSMVAPAGLSKRWENSAATATAEEFSLKVIELNPTLSYDVSRDFSIGGGLRLVYVDGVVKSNASNLLTRDLTGDTIEYGYNLALHYHPQNEWKVGLTYRSKIDLDVEGDAKITDLITPATAPYSGGASVTIPLPASLAIGISYDITPQTTVEFVIDRTFWSAYKNLDFNYDGTYTGVLDASIAKNWDDVNAYRIGVTHKWDDKLTLMGGFAYDENPIPDSTIGFELPDSDAYLFSFGFDYKIDDSMNVGFGYLYDMKKSRTATVSTISDEFTGGGAHMVNISLGYRF